MTGLNCCARFAHTVAAFLLAGGTSLAGGASLAQDYPNRPVRLIAPFTAGGPADVLGRALGETLRERTGQPFIIENRPGGNTSIGASACKNARPDGYTVCMMTFTTMSLNPFLYETLSYDPAKDFQPVTNIAFTRQILILHNSIPANTFAELVQYSKDNPEKLNFASFGIGSESHLVVEWLKRQTGAKFTHVPFAGAAPGMIAFERGDVHMFYLVATPAIVERIRSGQAKGILVPGDTRNPDLPDVPSYKDAGLPVLKTKNWFGLFAPGQTPPDIVEKLSGELSGSIKFKAFQERYLRGAGGDGVGDTPAEFRKFLAEDRDRAKELVVDSGVRLTQ